jgi:asparagine synthase (glutamine-hydrolysing)
MIADLSRLQDRVVHVDGAPITLSGRPLDRAKLRSIAMTDHDGWIDLARSLRGQFAILVAEAGQATVITDLTGSYPVFVLSTSNGLPSKLATSMAELEGGSKRSIRRSALFQYVACGSMDIDQETIYTDVVRVASGAVIFYTAAGEKCCAYAAWNEIANPSETDPDRAGHALESLIRTYIECGINAGEPLGILLSGGTDSTLLAAILRDPFYAAGRLKCFTQHFRWRRYSELAQAQANAGALEIETKPVMLNRPDHFEAVLALNSRQQDQPCLTMQAFNLWSLIHSVSGGCRAFVTGEHADSLFLGFGHFFHGLPSEQQAYLAATEALTPDQRIAWVAPRLAAADLDLELVSALGFPQAEYRQWLENFSDRRAAKLVPFRGLPLSSIQQLNGQIDGGLAWQRIMLPVTRSLEGIRILTPFFDPAVIALALGLAVPLKYRDGETKFLLRYLLNKHLGKALMKKPAAASPVAIWRILRSRRERLTVSPALRPYYDRLARGNTLSLGRGVNHYLRTAALGIWMGERGL